MMKAHARRLTILAAVVAAVGLVFWAGCSQDLMSPDKQSPTDSRITNPVDGSSLNKQVINVRGRAEVGATVDVYVNDVHQGSGQSLVFVPTNPGDDSSLGAFTVDAVDLGDEGAKTIRAKITDLYGNVAATPETPIITIELDQTAPPVEFTGMEGATWDTLLGHWESGLPRIYVSGTTDTTASGAHLRYATNLYSADDLVVDSGTGIVSFTIEVGSPPLSGGNTDTTIIYYLEAYDAAGNMQSEPVVVHWEILGQEETLSHDDGSYYFEDTITGFAGQKVAVRFQAPVWANYVTKIIYHTANDQIDNPIDPQLPTTEEFTAWVWRVTSTSDSLPGTAGNDGYLQPEGYPEDEWVTVTFPNAVDISNNSSYPDKKFFVGMEWENRLNPVFYEDRTPPIDYKSYKWNWSSWEVRLEADTMIRAVVSDVPGGGGREATLQPTSTSSR